jgi:hypothetical protein
MTIKRWLTLLMLSASSAPLLAACERVSQLMGSAYKTDAHLFASTTQLHRYQALAHVGIWSIYHQQAWSMDVCAPMKREGVTFYPVLRKANGFAVINGIWVIKTFREADIHQVGQRHGLTRVSLLPNRFSAVFQSPDIDSYDRLIERLDRDKDIERVVPVLVESGVR